MNHRRSFFIIQIFALAAIASAPVRAQEAPKLWVGGFGALDMGRISIAIREKTVDGMTYKNGFAAGAECDYATSDNFGITTQLAYVQKGGDRSFGGESSTLRYNFSYLQVPVLFSATFGSGNVRPVVYAGPEIGIKLSSTYRAKNSAGLDTVVAFPDSIFTVLNAGVMFGVGFTYAITPTMKLLVNAFYDVGVTNLNAQFGRNTPFTNDDETDVTRDVRISVGIVVGIGRSY